MIAHTEHRLPTSKSLRLVQIALELGGTPRTLVSEADSEKRYCLHCMYRVAAHNRIRISNRSCVNSRRLDVDVACLSRNLATFRVHMLHASVQLNFRRPPWKHELSRVMNYLHRHQDKCGSSRSSDPNFQLTRHDGATTAPNVWHLANINAALQLAAAGNFRHVRSP